MKNHIPHLLYVLVIIFGQSLDSNAQTLKADYQFKGNLNSSLAGVPALTDLTAANGANSFVTDSVDGYTQQTLRFSPVQLTVIH